MVERRADCSGQALGPYQLTRLLSAGGFGEVYEADHRLLQQKRALKLLLERHFHDPHQRERFLREARTLATLEHPNILPVLEVGEEGTMLYLVMPFYRRGTLGDLLKRRTTPLPLAEVEHFLAQMCEAVGYATLETSLTWISSQKTCFCTKMGGWSSPILGWRISLSRDGWKREVARVGELPITWPPNKSGESRNYAAISTRSASSCISCLPISAPSRAPRQKR